MPYLGVYQRKKLRKHLSLPNPNTSVRPNRAPTRHGGTIKRDSRWMTDEEKANKIPRRGVPLQPRGPRKFETIRDEETGEEMQVARPFDCRDGVLGNCPPDCNGRLHKGNGKQKQRANARRKGTLLIGQGVEIGAWHGDGVLERAKMSTQVADSLMKKAKVERRKGTGERGS
jgi:hypothetical protein